MSKRYEPRPINTLGIELEPDLERLQEILAASAHDNYAKRRHEEGWVYGPTRNDSLKTNPTLIPFDQLSEIDKDYDRNLVHETIKAMLALGCRISVPDENRFQERDIYAENAHARFQQGAYLLAFDKIKQAVDIWPRDKGLIQKQALYLNKLRAHTKAIDLLLPLAEAGDRDEETWGNLGSAYKSLGLAARLKEERRHYLGRAAQAYERGFELGGERAYWPGINAATLHMLAGDREKARQLASSMVEPCTARLSNTIDNEERYWVLATLGEVAILLGKWSEALGHYASAALAMPAAYGLYESTRRNARLLCENLGLDWTLIDHILPLPAIIVFAGHMIDKPNTGMRRFGTEKEVEVKAAIRAAVDELNGGYAFASAACGGDILFLEAMIDRGAEVHVVLPCKVEAFRRISVDYIVDADWGTRFDAVIRQARKVHIVSDEVLGPEDPTHQYVNAVVLGLAKMRCKQLRNALSAVAVWDGRPGVGPGGTADAVSLWREKAGIDQPVIIEPKRPYVMAPVAPREYDSSSQSKHTRHIKKGNGSNVELMTILFADVVGYTRMPERYTPHFIKHFIGGIAAILHSDSVMPSAMNTWGDAVHCVFEDPERAGQTALELCQFVESKGWAKEGLSEELDLQLRVSLHSGPVYHCYDAVVRRHAYYGSHICRAARIEPITPSNHVYASESYAALLAAEGVTTLACDYAGETRLAKAYGTFPVYHVRYAWSNRDPDFAQEPKT